MQSDQLVHRTVAELDSTLSHPVRLLGSPIMQNVSNQPLIQDAEEAPRGFVHEAMVAQLTSLPKCRRLWAAGFLRGRFFCVLSGEWGATW